MSQVEYIPHAMVNSWSAFIYIIVICIHVNDISDGIDRIQSMLEVFAIADDLKLYRIIKTPIDVDILQEYLNFFQLV